MFDFGRLEILCRRAGSLPPLPSVVDRLIRAIDGGTASAFDLERIITTEPILVAEIMRAVANSPFRLAADINSLRQAIILLGHRTIRSIAISFSIRTVTRLGCKSTCFDAGGFILQSSKVAVLARYLYARVMSKGPLNTDWTIDEVYAAALLHDLGSALFAHIDPEGYDRVWGISEALGESFRSAFHKCYNAEISCLGAAACESWKLPEVFIKSQKHMQFPAAEPRHLKSLNCILMAAYLVESAGPWRVKPIPEYVKNVVGVPDEEIPTLLDLIDQQTTAVHTGRPVPALR